MIAELTSAEKRRLIEGYGPLHVILKRLLMFEGGFSHDKEHLWVIGFQTLDYIKYVELVAMGGLNSVKAVPREAYRMAVHQGCNRILIAHNHPSGELKFSTADGKFTTRMAEAGDILGIDLLDHLVFTLDGWKSYNTYGKWSKPFGAKGSKPE